jgi:hypothetical protein
MAHKSHRKHLKHLHAHDPDKPKAKSPVEKIEVVKRRLAKPTAKASTAKASTAKQPASESAKAPVKKKGIVRSIARAATKKPRALISKAKARVKHLLGAD